MSVRKLTVTVNHVLDVVEGDAPAKEIARQWFYAQMSDLPVHVQGARVQPCGSTIVSVTERRLDAAA